MHGEGKVACLAKCNDDEINEDLESDQEEAGNRMMLHAKHGTSRCSRIVVQSPDKDVAMLCVAQFNAPWFKDLWFPHESQ